MDQEYGYVLDGMIREAGSLEGIVWTHADGSTSKFSELSTQAIMAIQRIVKLKYDTTSTQVDILQEQQQLQKNQKRTRKTAAKPLVAVPDGIAVGKFKKQINKATKSNTSFGFTLFVLKRVLDEREAKSLTVSPMVAKLRAKAFGRIAPRTPT